MPRKDKSEYNKYMADYMAKRYARRRAKILEDLGGKCARCEATKDLEIDHIDRSKKKIDISKLILATAEKLKAELVKCQLLCVECHTKKTQGEVGVPHGGGKKGKNGCTCQPCREQNRQYMRDRRAKLDQAV